MFTPSKRLLAAAAVTALTLCISACGDDSSDASGSSAKADLSSEAPTGVTLTLWHNTADSEALLDLYKRYEEESGNTIELFDVPSDAFESTVQSKWATGERPDILEWHGTTNSILQLNGEENFVDMSDMDFVEKEGALAEVSGNLDGKMYAATIGFPQVFGYFYNKKLLDEIGAEAPQTFDDIKTLCETVKAELPGVATVFEAGGSGWPPQITPANYLASYNEGDALSQEFTEDTSQISDPEGQLVEALTVYADLRDSGCFNDDANTAKYEDSLVAVYEGDALMVAQHSDNIDAFNTNAGGDKAAVDATLGFTGVSADGPNPWFAPSPLGTYYVPINEDEDKQRAALDFIEFATGEGYGEYVTQAGNNPVLAGTDAPSDLQGLRLEVGEAYEQANLGVGATIPGWNVFGDLITQLLADQITPEEVGKRIVASVEQAKAATDN